MGVATVHLLLLSVVALAASGAPGDTWCEEYPGSKNIVNCDEIVTNAECPVDERLPGSCDLLEHITGFFKSTDECSKNSECPSGSLCCYDACLGKTCKPSSGEAVPDSAPPSAATQPTDTENTTRASPLCWLLNGECMGQDEPCDGRSIINKAFCKSGDARKCCIPDSVCDPASCTHDNQNGSCSRYHLAGTINVGPQECKGGCQCFIQENKRLFVTVKTGDGLYAETNSKVHIEFEDHKNKSSEQFTISNPARGHLKRDGIDEYRVPIPNGFGRTATLKIGLDNDKRIIEDWYCDHILVEDPRDNSTLYFPIHQRIESNLTYDFENNDKCIVPKNGPRKSIRDEYQFTYTLTAAMVKTLPRDERFSFVYAAKFADMVAKVAFNKLEHYISWDIHRTIESIYYGFYPFPESHNSGNWKKDEWFGAQRVQGILPNIIQLCSEIPTKLGVTEYTVHGLLEDFTLVQALKNKKIFITDLHLLDGIEYQKGNINHASPIALFYLNKKHQLKPIAIQLWQNKGPANPIYTPHDPTNTWLVAKMYYNNAEAQFHEIVGHLSYTHLIMDGIATSMNRQLAPSHPVYRLLKPHFRFMMQINKLAEIALSSTGGSIDRFSIGTEGVKRLVAKAVPLFNFKTAIGSVESDARHRGVWDNDILPNYPFRDDAASIYNITEKYVTTILKDCYDNPASVVDDETLQNFHAELVKPRGDQGVGIIGLPGNDKTGFSNIDEVIDMVTTFIVQCSVGHAAVNFPQYDTYGYMPNYPAYMNVNPPRQKQNYTEETMMKLLPDMKHWLEIMEITRLLSWDGTNELGDYVKDYCNDQVCSQAHEQYVADLSKFSIEVKKINRLRQKEGQYPYVHLDPEYVPNAISI